VDSPVYSGDLIRAADISDATIHVDVNQIGLNENTLIRIEHAPDGKGPFQIELHGGNVSLTTGAGGSGLLLNLTDGRRVQAAPGTVLTAEIGKEGLVVQGIEGSATFIEEGRSRELSGGMMIAQDAEGVDRIIPAAVVTRPYPNARYINNLSEPLPVGFFWNSINIDDSEPLRLEISEDPNFVKNTRIVEDFDGQAHSAFDAGIWHWRLSQGNAILNTGQLTIVDASGPDLRSPAMNSVFRYHSELPQLRFQWSEKPGASHYILEIAETADFVNPRVSRELAAASFIQSELGPGTWYWRVRPVFSSAYEGSAAFSSAAAFRIEQTSDPQAPAIELPPPVAAAAPVRAGVRATGRHYTVRPGDTLFRIARQIYGNASLWMKIVDANNIPNPDLIFINQVLYIPE
jgi:hypothetical protein